MSRKRRKSKSSPKSQRQMQINAVEECNWIYPSQRGCINAKEEEKEREETKTRNANATLGRRTH
jgi:hypothetical protein